jgi:hypothetical protein
MGPGPVCRESGSGAFLLFLLLFLLLAELGVLHQLLAFEGLALGQGRLGQFDDVVWRVDEAGFRRLLCNKRSARSNTCRIVLPKETDDFPGAKHCAHYQKVKTEDEYELDADSYKVIARKRLHINLGEAKVKGEAKYVADYPREDDCARRQNA